MPLHDVPPLIIAPDATMEDRESVEIWLLLGLLADAGTARWHAASETFTCTLGIVLLGHN